MNQKQAIGDFEASNKIIMLSLSSKKKGRMFFGMCELDDQVKSDIKDLRGKGGNVDTTVVIACANAMVNREHRMIKDC